MIKGSALDLFVLIHHTVCEVDGIFFNMFSRVDNDLVQDLLLFEKTKYEISFWVLISQSIEKLDYQI